MSLGKSNFLLLLLVFACRKPLIAPKKGTLRFSRDTVAFDTLFSTLLSPTQRLWVYNPHPYPVRITKLFLAENSPFRLIWDGIPGQIHTNYLLDPGDSALAFISFRDTVNAPTEITDVLIFETEAEVQKVLLSIFLQDAYIYRNVQLPAGSSTLPTDKPTIIDGIFFIPDNSTLIVPAGAKLYFSGSRDPQTGELYSGIYVGGKLLMQGTALNPIQLQSWRREKYYQQQPGQWQGIHFLKTSQGSHLKNVIIRGASIAIRVDSIALSPTEPKVLLENVTLQDIANYGILGLGFSSVIGAAPTIRCINTLIFRCGQACAAFIAGGWYEIFHASWIFDIGDIRRGIGALLITDYYRPDLNTILSYPLRTHLTNSLLWSTKENAYIGDFANPSTAQVEFDHCHLRLKNPLPGINFYNEDPQLQPDNPPYAPMPTSPLRDKGIPTAITFDLKDNPRDANPDIGAYEIQP